MYLIGYDSGTSSIKAALMELETGSVVASATEPAKEMPIISHKPGWAEQNPEDWWEHLKTATGKVLQTSGVDCADIKAIGITYQMHGLICIDKECNVLRPSILWCDSRAVSYGQKATEAIGAQKCLEVMLNHPGNFTAAKLAWVKDNEPDIFKKIDKIMVPGDYLTMKMTGRIATTQSGLSEAILWDFQNKKLAGEVMAAFGFDPALIPEIEDTFAVHGKLTSQAASKLGLKAGTPVSYRAGDQPNNAYSLGVLEPGDIAATAGTSGVVCGISDRPCYDEKSRVNTFIHVNNSDEQPRYATLLCINGAGILNSWLKHNITEGMDYPEMNTLAQAIPVGSEGLVVLPYGNGAERPLENRIVGSSIHGLNFNAHTKAHLLRAAQEGIVFAFEYGLDIMKGIGLNVKVVRAGKANMFQSNVFAEAFATVTDSVIRLYNTDGAQGAARGAGYGAGFFCSINESFVGLEAAEEIVPIESNRGPYRDAYGRWLEKLRMYQQ